MDVDENSKYGYAKHIHDALPNANYIGFIGASIDLSTTTVFGDDIDTYNMKITIEE